MKKLVLVLMLIVTLASCGKKEEKKEYITYDTDGGEKLEPQLITDGFKLLVPDKEGYVFIGWKDDEGNYVSENDIKSSIHLTAEYSNEKFHFTEGYLIIINITDSGTNYLNLIRGKESEKIVPTIDIDYYRLILDGKPYEYGTEIVLKGTRKLVIYS